MCKPSLICAIGSMKSWVCAERLQSVSDRCILLCAAFFRGADSLDPKQTFRGADPNTARHMLVHSLFPSRAGRAE